MTTRKHNWVRYTQEVVDVIVDPDGVPFAVTSPCEPVGQATGCGDCGCPLTFETVTTVCEPQPEVAPA